MENEHPVQRLISLLKGGQKVYIQPHDFPDHDAIASAFGLQQLLRVFGIEASIIYAGTIQRESLRHFIEKLSIPAHHFTRADPEEDSKIVIVDGCKGNKNVLDLPGVEVGVIDHHKNDKPDDVPFTDIREEYGSCASIIEEYYHDMDVPVSEDTATALLTGIIMDTAKLTRKVTDHDLAAYARLHKRADRDYVNTLSRNNIQSDDLVYFKQLINTVVLREDVAFAFFPEGCSQNLLGIMGDFMLSVDSVHFVLLCAQNGDNIILSLRNEIPGVDASMVIRSIIQQKGFAGGHPDMAGGIIKEPEVFDEKELFADLLESLGKEPISAEENRTLFQAE